MTQRERHEEEWLANLLSRIESLSHKKARDNKEPISFYQGVALLFAEPHLSVKTGGSTSTAIKQ